MESLVTEDAETSKTRATNLAAMMTKQKEAIEKKTKEDLMDGTKGGAGGGAGGGTGDDPEDDSDGAKYAQLYNGQYEV